MESNNKILLKPAMSRVMKIIMYFIVTIVINAIAWVAINDKRVPDYLTYVIGGFCVYLVLSTLNTARVLMNTKVDVFVNNNPVKIGQTLIISWEASRKVDQIKILTFSIFLMECHTHGHGENKKVKTKKIHDEILFKIEDRNRLSSGSKSITIPRVFRPSYSNDNYELGWFLKVHGEIPFSPDIDEDYMITILPEDNVGIEEN